MNRRTLPQRRYAETSDCRFQGKVFQVTAGFHDDGRLAEVFINGAKVGSDRDGETRDGAVITSIGLQYGVPLDVLVGAITRNPDGRPSSAIGAVLEHLKWRYGNGRPTAADVGALAGLKKQDSRRRGDDALIDVRISQADGRADQDHAERP